MTDDAEPSVREAFVSLLREHVEDDVVIRGESSITGDLALDSLAIMEIMADVEDRFGIVIPDDVLPELHTVDDVVRALEARVKKVRA